MPRKGTPPHDRSRLFSTPRWRKLREFVLERDGWRCQIRLPGCEGEAREVDHIRPLELGGPAWDPGNLRAACSYCNRSRGASLLGRLRAQALAREKGRPVRDPCRGHSREYPGDLGPNQICEACGALGPSRRW
ncbi:MAG TPA: HNH endonuclease signature motif containing protein [Actinomycetota bacterium]|nr:HNH endonuclease signature motif containing protein [Actinomycetota bacterium]